MKRIRTRRNWLVAALGILSAALLGGCVTAKEIGSPEGVVDDGKTNTVLLSYSVRMEVFELYAGNRGTTLELHCLNDGNVSGSNGCFSIWVPYTGARPDPETGVLMETFQTSGVQPFQMPYQNYELVDSRFKVLIDREPIENCKLNRKGRLRCHTTYLDKHNRIRVNVPESLPINVAAGDGCFAGHIDLYMRGEEIVDWSIRTELTEEDIQQVAPVLRERVRDHVTRPCAPTA